MNYEKNLDEALERIIKAVNKIIDQTTRPIIQSMPVSAKEMMRLAMDNDLRLGHYLHV